MSFKDMGDTAASWIVGASILVFFAQIIFFIYNGAWPEGDPAMIYAIFLLSDDYKAADLIRLPPGQFDYAHNAILSSSWGFELKGIELVRKFIADVHVFVISIPLALAVSFLGTQATAPTHRY